MQLLYCNVLRRQINTYIWGILREDLQQIGSVSYVQHYQVYVWSTILRAVKIVRIRLYRTAVVTL